MPSLPQFGQRASFKTAIAETIAIITTIMQKNIDSSKTTHVIPKIAVRLNKKYANVILSVLLISKPPCSVKYQSCHIGNTSFTVNL